MSKQTYTVRDHRIYLANGEAIRLTGNAPEWLLNLIAAAPELLEACEAALKMPIPWVRSSQGRRDLAKYREVIQAAITKAES